MNYDEGSFLKKGLGLAVLLGCVACGGPTTPMDSGAGDARDSGASDARDGGDDGGDAGDAGDGATPVACDQLPLPGAVGQGHWDPHFTIAGFTGHDGLVPTVYDFAQDRDGNVLATGRFQWMGHERVQPLMRLRNGQWEQARTTWELTPSQGGFSALAAGADGRLALSTYGGANDLGSGEPTGQLWVDTGTGLRAIGHFTGAVRSLVWFHDALWVAGDFLLMENSAAGLAVWNGTAWSTPPGGGADGPVFRLVASDTSVIAAGAFAHVGGTAAQKVAEWNGTSWRAYDLPGGAAVYAVARDADGTLLAGGSFFDDPSDGTGSVARWNGTAWELLGGGVSHGMWPGVVSDMVLHQGRVYIAGCFDHVNGAVTNPAAVRAAQVARWNGTAWEPLDDASQPLGSAWFDPGSCGDEGPRAIWEASHQRLFSDGTRVFLAGSFAGHGGVPSQSIIAYDGAHWQAQGAPAERGLVGAPQAFAVGGPGCALHALGGVTNVGDQRVAGRVLRYRDGWSAVGGPTPAELMCSRIAVDAAGGVFLGCSTQPDASDPEPRVFRLAGDQWVSVGDLHATGPLQDMALDPNGTLWVVGGGATGYVARLDGEHFTVVEDGFDALVYRLAFEPPSTSGGPIGLVVGGAFTHLGAREFTRVARWDGAAWAPLGAGFSSTVIALAYGADAIYASTSDEGTPDRAILARWDGAQWTELATPARGIPAPMGQSSHTFTSLIARGGTLLAAGYVWPETGGRNAFVYDGTRFTTIGGGVPAISVDELALAGDGLWFGGTIAEAGLDDARVASVGVARWYWGANP